MDNKLIAASLRAIAAQFDNGVGAVEPAAVDPLAVWRNMGDNAWRATVPEPRIERRSIGDLDAGFTAFAQRPDGTVVHGYGSTPVLARENFVTKWGEAASGKTGVLDLLARCAVVITEYARHQRDTSAEPIERWSNERIRQVANATFVLADELKPYLEI